MKSGMKVRKWTLPFTQRADREAEASSPSSASCASPLADVFPGEASTLDCHKFCSSPWKMVGEGRKGGKQARRPNTSVLFGRINLILHCVDEFLSERRSQHPSPTCKRVQVETFDAGDGLTSSRAKDSGGDRAFQREPPFAQHVSDSARRPVVPKNAEESLRKARTRETEPARERSAKLELQQGAIASTAGGSKFGVEPTRFCSRKKAEKVCRGSVGIGVFLTSSQAFRK